VRIGLIIYGSLDTLSGGYLYDRRLVEYLRAQGDQVEILSQPWQSYPRHLAHNLSNRLVDQAARLDLDLLLEDELNHPSLFLLNRRLRTRLNIPILSIVHHLRSSEKHPGLALRLYRLVERAYLRSVDRFIFNSQTTHNAVEALLGRPAPGTVAYPGGDRFGECLSEAAICLRARRTGPLRLLFVGNVIPRKDLKTLILAMGRLEEQSCILHVVGRRDVDPSYARWMDDLIEELDLKERVIYRGPLSDDQLRDAWKRSDLLVVPSQYEGFGIVYLEAFAFGLPAIATTSGAAREIITPGETGYRIPPGDDATLAAHLQSLSADRNELERLSLNARRKFAGFPTWEDTGKKIRAFLLASTGVG
jgi:glycosyltransferase involved in cell wall biosynthesis